LNGQLEDKINYQSFVYYESFYLAMKNLDNDEKAEYIWAICNYGLYHKISTMSPKIESLFILIKPQIDANLKRRKNGKKGGRPLKDKP